MKNHLKRQTVGTLARWFLILAGTIFLGLAAIGVVLPLIPTTPFLLLAAACYARSSKRFSNWLLGNRFFGKVVQNYREGKGIPLKIKVFSISLLWITIGCSVAFAINILAVQIILILIAFGVTLHIMFLPTPRQL
jgi:uncharacterized membrane protein YbaN (DUF454 family)